MKRIKYFYNIPVNTGDAENPVWEDRLYEKTLPYSVEAEEIAKREAYNGEYAIEDDGKPEPIPAGEPVTWDELDSAYQEGVDSI